MRQILITLTLATCLTTQVFADIKPVPSHDVSLDKSFVTEREALDIQFIRALDTDRLLHNFRVTAGISSSAQPLEGWEAPGCGLRGHFVGHYMSAVSSLVNRKHDVDLQTKLNKLIDGLEACQQKMGQGYMSAFPADEFDKLEQTGVGIWAPYYTWHKLMQGLLDAYVLTGNKKAYQIVLGMADYIKARMDKLDTQTIDRMMNTQQANPVNEMGGMNDVLHQLYHLSHNIDHLRLARLFEPDWFLSPLVGNNDQLSGLHSNTHIALVNGFATAYSNGRESKYHDASIHFWDMLLHHHAYANGSSSGPRPVVTTPTSKTAEHWGESDKLAVTLWSHEIAESCVSHNTQRLTSMLFCWTGNATYADSYMNMFYNAVLPTQSKTTGRVVYHLPLGIPRTKKYLQNNEYVCCSGSGMEAFAKLNAGIYYDDKKTLYVNQYIPSTLTWNDGGLTLQQQGTFPYNSTVDIRILASKKRRNTINLFIPSWAHDTEVYVNGERWTGECIPQSYASISRKWKVGDTVHLVFHPSFHLVATPDNSDIVAIYYGPLMMAFETDQEIMLKGHPNDLLANLSVTNQGPDRISVRLQNNGHTYILRPLMDIDAESYEVYATLKN